MLNMVLLDTEKLPKKQFAQMEQRLTQLGNLTSYVNTSLGEVVARCGEAEIILTNKEVINAQHIKALPNLKYIIVIATGYDNVDVVTAREYGIKVSNIPTYGSQTVAQHAIALLLELTNQVGKVSQMVKAGKWQGTGHKHLELANLTMGVFGFGNIAQCTIKIALGLGMKILVCGSKGINAKYVTSLPVEFVDREMIFRQSDVITLHCPINDATLELINKDSLALMKQNCLLINTSRGKLINENDLYQALSTGQIRGAGLDVLQQEPVNPDNPLLTLDNCFFSPHNAWVSEAALKRWLNDIENYVTNYLQDKFINLV